MARQRAGRGLDVQRAALTVLAFEHQRHRHHVAGLHLALEVEQHHVVAAGLELHGLAGGQREAFDFAHAHDVFFHRHFVDLGHARDGGTGLDHACVGLGGELHEGASGLLLRHGGAHPGVFHFNVGGGLGPGAGGHGQQGAEKQVFHEKGLSRHLNGHRPTRGTRLRGRRKNNAGGAPFKKGERLTPAVEREAAQQARRWRMKGDLAAPAAQRPRARARG